MSFFTTKVKKYGLIMPSGKKTTAAKPIAKLSAFGDSSSDEEDDGKRHVNATLKREQAKSKKQMEEAASQALAEDPSIFEYDSLYDQMVEEKKKKAQNLSSQRKPKYVHALKKAAERRKLEGELAYEHLAQKEIEKDAEEFRGKESFVTSAYKKKLEERRQLEEELAREAALEEANDVTKQKDLSRFQKHLFNQIASPSGSDVKQPQSSEGRETQREDKGSGGLSRNKVDKTEERDEQRREKRQSFERREGGGRERRRPSSEGGKERRDSRGEEREQKDRDRRDRERRDSRGEEREQRDRDRRDSRGEEREQKDRDRRDRERRDSKGEEREQRDRREREKRDSGDRDGSRHSGERRSSHRDRRESQDTENIPENETEDKHVDSGEAHTTDKTEEDSTPPKKRIRIRAGIEVEEEDITPVDRRKLAAAKKATDETTMSAKERYLARKRAKAETEPRKHSTSDD